MTSGTDDFWGNQSDWSDRARSEPTTRIPRVDAASDASDELWNTEREQPAQRIARGWSKLLGSGANPTRSHGLVRPDAARVADTPIDPNGISADMFDDLDDFDFTDGEPFAVSDTSSVATSAGGVPTGFLDDGHGDGAVENWDAEFAPATIATGRRVASGGVGPRVDPLLLRLGVVAVVAALLVPALLSLRGGDDDSLVESSTTPSTLDLLPVETETPVEVAPTTPATGQLDPNDLPPATPVNTVAVPDPTVVPDDADELTAPEADSSATLAGTEATAAVVDAPPATDVPTETQPAAGAPATVDAPAERVERDCAIDYEVVAGDYWIRIADAAGVPLAELLEANGATVSTSIYPGRSICLPAGSTTPSAPTTTTAPTTTPPPVTTTPTTTPSNSNATPEEVKQIIRDAWPDELEERALEIAFRESRYVPTAKNFCCYGIFQIYWSVHRGWLADLGITNDQQLYDPATNARAAYALYQRAGGWGPWNL